MRLLEKFTRCHTGYKIRYMVAYIDNNHILNAVKWSHKRMHLFSRPIPEESVAITLRYDYRNVGNYMALKEIIEAIKFETGVSISTKDIIVNSLDEFLKRHPYNGRYVLNNYNNILSYDYDKCNKLFNSYMERNVFNTDKYLN